jgi:hypothetical protein
VTRRALLAALAGSGAGLPRDVKFNWEIVNPKFGSSPRSATT